MLKAAHSETVLEARCSLLVERQRDPSSAAEAIDYALSYGIENVVDILYDKQVYRRTVALGPIVKIARNAGATTRV
jgi:MinD superfamily P-loop ATPase